MTQGEDQNIELPLNFVVHTIKQNVLEHANEQGFLFNNAACR